MEDKRIKVKPIKYIVSNDIPDRKDITWHVYAVTQEMEGKPPERRHSLHLNYYEEDNRYHFKSVPWDSPPAFPFGASLLFPTTIQKVEFTDKRRPVDETVYDAKSLTEACDKFFGSHETVYEIENP